MHPLIHTLHDLALVDGATLLLAAHGAPHPLPELARLAGAATQAAGQSQTGHFALVADLLGGGILLIACGAFGLRRSR